MKKIILFGIALLFANQIFTQRCIADFGLKGGVNFSNLKIGTNSNTDSRTGFHVGMLSHMHLSRLWALQHEVYFSSQGASYANDKKDRLNYINIPLLVQLMPGEGFRLQTGPQIGFLASAHTKNGNAETNIKNNLKKVDFSWSFGTSYLSSSGLGLDIRYNLGINNISKTTADIQNRVWQIGLFYQFRRYVKS